LRNTHLIVEASNRFTPQKLIGHFKESYLPNPPTSSEKMMELTNRARQTLNQINTPQSGSTQVYSNPKTNFEKNKKILASVTAK